MSIDAAGDMIDKIAAERDQLKATNERLRAALARCVMLADVASEEPNDLLRDTREIGQRALNETDGGLREGAGQELEAVLDTTQPVVWEYFCHRILPVDVSTDSIDQQLNKYGKNRWELVAVCDYIAYFKRPILPFASNENMQSSGE